jgi:putative glutamine amidotransferase
VTELSSETASPLIGISCYALQARWGAWDDQAVLLPRRYADKVAQAGGLPVLLPPVPGISEVVARLDGLVLSGGSDIDPARYRSPQGTQTGPVYPERDSAELALCAAALDHGLPLLGICRGLQVINVALGGTLHQHLPDVVGHDGHSPQEAGYGRHDVRIAPGSRLAAILGRTTAAVPTHHHQAADQLGSGLVATAWTDDGVIEAFEFSAPAGDAFMIAVQWHPEAGDDPGLFRGLVAAASRLRERAPALA